MANIYTIPAGLPFAKALASGLLKQYGDTPETLAAITILLPTRRACRTLQDAFLSLSGDKPLLLPKLQPIGHIDEEELSLSIAGHEGIEELTTIPPAIDPLRRQCLLAQLIRNVPSRNDSPASAFALAGTLAHLLDQIHTEGLDFTTLSNLAPADFAQHWQITLDFLSILSEHWPRILEVEGTIDPASRRDRLIRTLSAHWHKCPPSHPVIAAGSTGTIPATRELLKTIANLPQGTLILPGLDTGISDEDWETIPASHPQAGLKKLLTHCETERSAVQSWDHTLTAPPLTEARQTLAREIMRPEDSTDHWTNLPDNPQTADHIRAACETLPIYETTNEQDEATLIALLMREVLETPDKTCTLITPDRNLARRVAAACHRWNIDIDDSSGWPLSKTKAGTLFRLIAECEAHAYAPAQLLALLKHELCFPYFEPHDYHQGLCQIEAAILENDKKPGLFDLINHFNKAEEAETQHAQEILGSLQQAITGSGSQEYNNIKYLSEKIMQIYDALTGQRLEMIHNDSNTQRDEKSIKDHLISLSNQSVAFNKITPADFAEIMTLLLNSQTVRSVQNTKHPRLKILGQIEARMLEADTVILAGLNEGTWPEDHNSDPWMSLPMKKEFGLPTAEQNLSLSAHDFVQCLCHPGTLITRSKEKSSSPTLPSRWLQKINMIAKTCNTDLNKNNTHQQFNWLKALNEKTDTITLSRPAPTPPPQTRPQKLSVTAIETWLKDPYSIYAKHILKLKKWGDLSDDKKAAIKGTLLHDTLDWFVTNIPEPFPADAIDRLMEKARELAQERVTDPSIWSFWEPQFRAAFNATLNNEMKWREKANPLKTEALGHTPIKTQKTTLTLTARADRIDRFKNDPANPYKDNTPKAALIDYKSGGTFTKSGLETGQYPQLILEALILSEGGFQDLPPMETESLSYWLITGGTKSGTIIETQTDIKTLTATTREKLIHLIDTYADEATPYLSIPNPNNQPRFNDYRHLARIEEWSDNIATAGNREDAA